MVSNHTCQEKILRIFGFFLDPLDPGGYGHYRILFPLYLH
jgi:hypothetical protein